MLFGDALLPSPPASPAAAAAAEETGSGLTAQSCPAAAAAAEETGKGLTAPKLPRRRRRRAAAEETGEGLTAQSCPAGPPPPAAPAPAPAPRHSDAASAAAALFETSKTPSGGIRLVDLVEALDPPSAAPVPFGWKPSRVVPDEFRQLTKPCYSPVSNDSSHEPSPVQQELLRNGQFYDFCNC